LVSIGYCQLQAQRIADLLDFAAGQIIKEVIIIGAAYVDLLSINLIHLKIHLIKHILFSQSTVTLARQAQLVGFLNSNPW